MTYVGANPSQEEQDEALEDGATQVNNVVHSFRLQQTQFDKKSYLTYLKVSLLSSDIDKVGRHSEPGIYESCEDETRRDRP